MSDEALDEVIAELESYDSDGPEDVAEVEEVDYGDAD